MNVLDAVRAYRSIRPDPVLTVLAEPLDPHRGAWLAEVGVGLSALDPEPCGLTVVELEMDLEGASGLLPVRLDVKICGGRVRCSEQGGLPGAGGAVVVPLVSPETLDD